MWDVAKIRAFMGLPAQQSSSSTDDYFLSFRERMRNVKGGVTLSLEEKAIYEPMLESMRASASRPCRTYGTDITRGVVGKFDQTWWSGIPGVPFVTSVPCVVIDDPLPAEGWGDEVMLDFYGTEELPYYEKMECGEGVLYGSDEFFQLKREIRHYQCAKMDYEEIIDRIEILKGYEALFLTCAGVISSNNTSQLRRFLLQRVKATGSNVELPGILFDYAGHLIPYGYTLSETEEDVYIASDTLLSETGRVAGDYAHYRILPTWRERKQWSESHRVMWPLAVTAFPTVSSAAWTSDSLACSVYLAARCLTEEPLTGVPRLYRDPDCLTWASTYPPMADAAKRFVCRSQGVCSVPIVESENEMLSLLHSNPIPSQVQQRCLSNEGTWTPMVLNDSRSDIWHICRCLLVDKNTDYASYLRLVSAATRATMKDPSATVQTNVPVSPSNLPFMCYFPSCMGNDFLQTEQMKIDATQCGDVILTCANTNATFTPTVSLQAQMNNDCKVTIEEVDQNASNAEQTNVESASTVEETIQIDGSTVTRPTAYTRLNGAAVQIPSLFVDPNTDSPLQDSLGDDQYLTLEEQIRERQRGGTFLQSFQGIYFVLGLCLSVCLGAFLFHFYLMTTESTQPYLPEDLKRWKQHTRKQMDPYHTAHRT